jgi:hypothetical protein
MKKLILFASALLVAGQASAYAQGEHHKHHRHIMAAHAQWRGNEGGYNYRTREYAPEMIVPPYGDDPEAEGRTSGGN